MNTLNFLDANVWLALLWGRHIHSERARDWLEKSSEGKFFSCRFTQLTVIRLLTLRAVKV
jgi:predicted nucleic acid-binding protein